MPPDRARPWPVLRRPIHWRGRQPAVHAGLVQGAGAQRGARSRLILARAVLSPAPWRRRRAVLAPAVACRHRLPVAPWSCRGCRPWPSAGGRLSAAAHADDLDGRGRGAGLRRDRFAARLLGLADRLADRLYPAGHALAAGGRDRATPLAPRRVRLWPVPGDRLGWLCIRQRGDGRGDAARAGGLGADLDRRRRGAGQLSAARLLPPREPMYETLERSRRRAGADAGAWADCCATRPSCWRSARSG